MAGLPLLYKTISSHLVVAVVPALALGYLVSDVNRRGLELDAQHLHLATAGQLHQRILAKIDETTQVLETAERVLASEQLPYEQRIVLLQSIVASGRAPELAIYTADGAPDSVIRGPKAAPGERAPLSEALRQDARARGFAADRAERAEGGIQLRLVVPWILDEQLFGFLGTTIPLAPLSEFAKALAERHLGENGELDVVDGRKMVLVSVDPARLGTTLGDDSPFRGIEGADGLAAIEGGISVPFDAPSGARLGAVVSMPTTRWLIGASRPAAEAFAVLGAVRKRTLLLALLAAALAGIAGLLFARQISEPVKRLTEEARTAVARGFKTTLDLRAGGELGALVTSFNEMLRQIERYRADLRVKTNLQMKLARILSPAELHELLATEAMPDRTAEEHVATVLYVDVARTGSEVTTVRQEFLVTMLGDFFAAAVSAIERSGGQVDRYSGDAVIGVFLARHVPAHAAAAREAAQVILREVAEQAKRWAAISAELEASVGVATGTVRVRAVGDGSSGELSVSGGLVDRAAELQREAQAGTFRLDAETDAALGGRS